MVEVGTLPDATSTALSVSERMDITYDSRRNAIRTIRSSGGVNYAVLDKSFDNRGRLDCETVRMNLAALPAASATAACSLGSAGAQGADRITRRVYDVASQLTKTQVAVGTVVAADDETNSYTANGKLATVTDGENNRTTFDYDGHDRLTKTRYPVASVGALASSTTDFEQLTYDAAGNRVSLRKRDGTVITYQYDALNRLVVKIIPERVGLSAIHTRDVYYGYDIRGLQTYARFDSAGGEGVSSVYDALGRPISVTTVLGGLNQTLTHQYDTRGNRTRITHPDGTWFDMVYDSLSRMTNALWVKGSIGPVPFMAITYDDLGRRVDINRASSYTGYSYDPASRLSAMNQRFAGGAGNASETFAYNPASQITGHTRDNDAYAWKGHFNVNRAYGTNGLNQLTSAGPASFSYDANGNLTSDGTTTYTYDPLGRMFSVSGSGGATTRFLYDGDALVAEYDAAGNVTNRYMHGPGTDEPILWDVGSAMNCAGGSTRFLHTNAQGSIIAVADCNGNRVAVNAYDEYGIPAGLISGSTPNTGRFQYTGQLWLSELGLYYYKARMYSPFIGRFMQTDPIGYGDGINWYDYVDGDPVNGVDPDGESRRPITGFPNNPNAPRSFTQQLNSQVYRARASEIQQINPRQLQKLPQFLGPPSGADVQGVTGAARVLKLALPGSFNSSSALNTGGAAGQQVRAALSGANFDGPTAKGALNFTAGGGVNAQAAAISALGGNGSRLSFGGGLFATTQAYTATGQNSNSAPTVTLNFTQYVPPTGSNISRPINVRTIKIRF